MDRSNPLSSNASSNSKQASGPFAYQTRLLERTSSISRASPLSRTRSHSQSSNLSLVSNNTGTNSTTTPTPAPARRWTPSHRVGNSLDLVRGKWEERSREGTGDSVPSSPGSPLKEAFQRTHPQSVTSLAIGRGIDHVRDRGERSFSDLPETSRAASPTKDIPTAPATPVSSGSHSHIDSVRDKWETRTREAEGQASSSTLSWSPSKDSSRFTPLKPSMTSSSTSSSGISSGSSGIGAVRGKWEERSREAALSSPSPTKESFRSASSTSLSSYASSSPSKSKTDVDLQRTPTYLKRQTMPAPIIASPLSPNTTGISVEVDSPNSSIPARIRLPVTPSSTESQLSKPPEKGNSAVTTRLRSATLITDSPTPSIHLHYARDKPAANGPEAEQTPLRRRPTSAQGFYSHLSASTDRLSTLRAGQVESFKSPSTPTAPNSVMSPTPYRSSYMSGKAKKLDSYRDLGGGSGRMKLGRHLPRIASGDGDETWESKNEPVPPVPPPRDDVAARREKRLARLRSMQMNDTHLSNHATPPTSDGVAGLPGRISLRAPKNDQQPVPSARLIGATWADKQRHLIQAYEYLCHVGEAQQWIEGCLGEELDFGVVEMEEGLRNGVVLAKLVRAFEGQQAVRRIYQAPKLDFRHSDNINIFFDFVRKEGLPEGFIFELTDLYDKKNIPKVIYCIHALSHLLARRGRAQRIGNLLGQLQFSDDQLTKTQKGLKDAGVSMPNFGNVGKELAKEINEEPEVEVETEDERRDRLLLENEASIIRLQAYCRGGLSRRNHKALQARIKLSERHVVKFQTHCMGALLRRRLAQRRQVQSQLVPWATALQAACRAAILRRQWRLYLRRIKSISPQVIKLQSQIRGVLMRRRFAKMKSALQKMSVSFTKMQALARAHVTRHARSQLQKTFYKPQINFSIVGLQAHARALLVRRRITLLMHALQRKEINFVHLQAQCRGILVRRRMRARMAKIRTATDVVIAIQSAVRTYLARKRLLTLIRGLRKATPFIVAIQSRARASLMRQEHKSVNKALKHVHTITSVHSLQALARASLTRRRHQQLSKTLEVATPDVVNVQSVARGFLVRQEYRAWRDHLHRSHPIATMLQAMLRGALQRRAYHAKLNYFKANLSKVVKIQSLFRAKETREQYRQLTLGKNVTVGTIKNFVHLLDDSEADFQEEIKVERLRKRVVEAIRENQALENDVNELDVKIALVVQNAMNFEDIVKAKKRYGGDSAAAQAARASLLAAHGDPFSGPNTLDQDARRKLELYQQLFYLLQSRGEYLSRLFLRLSKENVPDASRRFIERVVLTLFGYGQDHREDFLLLKLFQYSIRDQISIAPTIEHVTKGHPLYLNVAVHYLRSKQATFVREAFQGVLKEVINADDLDLEVDPSIIHRNRIDVEEMRTGRMNPAPRDVSFREALEDPETRPIYIRHLQILRWWTEQFMTAIIQSTRKMPYGVRYLARELLLCLRHKFPGAPEELYAACIGRLIYYRYINPAIITPETFDVVSKTVDVACRKNLAQISKVLTQVASGAPFGDDSPAYLPLNDYVIKAIAQMNGWFLEVANVPDAETQYHAHEFLDVTVQPKPIYISPNEIYNLHSLLLQHQEALASADDPMRVILSELGGVPHLDNEELKDARDTAITLELTNRFANVQDPHAEEKTLWVQAKRGVLAILRVQPAQDLLESLMRPVTENDEMLWEDILEAEMENELKQMPRRQPSTAVVDSAYRLEDIRSLKFAAVKALAIQNLLELERQGKITRNDGFQGILNAIAGDVRSKHRKRIQRQQEMSNMAEALRQLAERKKYFMEQIDSYHSYVDSAMNTMQRGGKKKRFVLPFTKQFYHLRELQRTGQTPKFGSFIYSAKHLYDKGILLSIDSYSPRQFDKLQITLSSNKAGVFTVLLESTMLAVVSKIAQEDIKMEDLLQAKYEKRPSLSILGGKMKVNFELFLYQINKKFYV
ncbi:IQ domain-containing protein-containing RasGAP [Coprinopsis cinerea okayama7|uniref:IQ domain-containing protein-containing RasGAP n=1 Tax=Coprinopsis cinerea (strain Okayama-7 / 130 / ATCC MYA-4618 / FGSC 9003) TaxID=240176 RepID=A8NXF5_COPC7|nr:IQ domain-containing protein-containing RasGAP [Coprinopsis cinerea okayama7\|eukprot:XP_001837153.2 IQ domain-containing protein-containing RasGAP [Coprinopsis cinerea okayama7\